MEKLTICAAVVLYNKKTGKVLGVSRKNNHKDFSLVGGKSESFDLTPMDTALREMWEEIRVKREKKDLTLLHEGEYYGNYQMTYLLDYDGDDFSSDEPHVIKWCELDEIMAGSFGEYNRMIFELMGLIAA